MKYLEIVKGSIAVGRSGNGKRIDIIEGDILHSGDLKLDRRGVVQIIQPSPRKAIISNSGKIEVDIDRLALNYQPSVTTPSWEPNTQIKPYEELTKLYLDIETTGLQPKIDRVLMVGLLNERGETTILTHPDEKTLLAQTIEHLKQHQPECLIGHNLINFDLPFLADRCRIHNISHPFRKGNKISRITSSTVNGQPIEFTPIYWNGVNILDTYQQIAIWDKQAAKLARYDLKSSVIALGLRDDIALGLRDDRRLELSVNEIKDCWAAGDTETIDRELSEIRP